MRPSRVLTLVAITAGLLVALIAGPASWTASGADGSHTLTPAPACPGEDSCVTIAGNSSVGGGTVEAGPTQNLGDNQWVYINTYGFTPDAQLRADLCTDTAALVSSQPLCLSAPTTLILNAASAVTTLADGTEQWSYQVGEESTSSPPLPGRVISTGAPGSFYCDATHQCSVDITNIGVGASNQDDPFSAQNTAVLPITFASNTLGCGTTAASVDTESEFGMELLLPIAAANSCNNPNPTIAFNTALDGVGAVTAVQSDAAEVAFTDDPEVAGQQAVLKQGNFKLIPVALTANVVGFKAQMGEDQLPFPLPGLDLTPNMAAGLLIGTYTGPNGADAVKCSKIAGGCATAACGSAKPVYCSVLAMLNYRAGFSLPTSFQTFVRSDTAGSTGLFFDWLCNAPSAATDPSVAVPISVTPAGAPHSRTPSRNRNQAPLFWRRPSGLPAIRSRLARTTTSTRPRRWVPRCSTTPTTTRTSRC